MGAANAASFALKAVPALLGEVWVLEGLSQNDPGRIADGLMMAASAGASFGEGLGAGPRAGGGVRIGPQWKPRKIADAACENGCESVARQIQKYIGGEVVRITPKDTPGLGAFRGKNWGWSHHEVVVKDGRVCDLTTGCEGG
ncbi:hypothetical protein [Sorangium cellulosum]|uniref:hypothetical protein n=1 Tax=Sorangium cellulosum TaxID=56 RepID=UPI0003FE9BF9|nr:hypothetical protein [Sorangium cellulosum]